MSLRGWIGLTVGAGYLAVLAHATAGARCPVPPETTCATIHDLMRTARPPAPMIASPMRAPGMPVALLPARTEAGRV